MGLESLKGSRRWSEFAVCTEQRLGKASKSVSLCGKGWQRSAASLEGMELSLLL